VTAIVLVVVGTLVGLGFAFGGPALAVLLVLAALVVFGWLLVLACRGAHPRTSRSALTKASSSGPAARTIRTANG
jgi:hypothetical protein